MLPRTCRSTFFHLIFFLSGVAGLGYQLVWTRSFAVGLGHEIASVLAVVAAFFAGLALGGWLLARRVDVSPEAGGWWYVRLELIIGVWGLATIVIIPWANERLPFLIGLDAHPIRHWGVAFLVPLVALLPATAAMGATLPAMERLVSQFRRDGLVVGGLYAANTLGAVVGTLAGVMVLAPALGFRLTLIVLAALNFLCALVVAMELRAWMPSIDIAERVKPQWGSSSKTTPSKNGITGGISARRLLLTLLCTGLLGIGYEVLAVRIMGQVLENTVYSFAALLSIYLVATALGGALYQRFIAGRGAMDRILAALLHSLAVACLLGALAIASTAAIYEAVRGALGGSEWAAIAAEMAVAAVVLGLPAMLMGGLFSHLVQFARILESSTSSVDVETDHRPLGLVGRAVAINTFGGALAPALFGVVLLPVLGAKWSLVATSIAYLALLPRWRPADGLRLGLPLVLLLVMPANLRLITTPVRSSLVEYREGVMAAVAVVQDSAGNKFLKVNNRFQMGGTATFFAERRIAHLPLLLHENPRRALFLGVGTGVTFGAASRYAGLRSDGVELVPEVIDTLHWFAPTNEDPQSRANLSLHVADARRWIRASAERYDVIIADLFHPWLDGAGSLYTREHFLAVRERLTDGGFFCQWLPLYQLDDRMFKVILRTYLDVFPDAVAIIGHYNVETPMLGLISRVPEGLTEGWFDRRTSSPGLRDSLRILALDDGLRVLGCVVGDAETLSAFAGDGPLNTDDRPIVTFGAPRYTYEQRDTSYGRLLNLLRAGQRSARETLGPELADSDRLDRFWNARNIFVRGRVASVEGREDEAIAAYVESARASEDFTTGYAIVIDWARRNAGSQPDQAIELLRQLIVAQPLNPEASAVLREVSRR